MRRVKKSRNGCARCKSKRVKCGEELPACSRCTRLGVKCPGYVQPLRWVTKYERLEHRENGDARSDAISASPKPSPTQTELVDPLSQSPLSFDNDLNIPTQQPRPEARSIDIDGANALCDTLWDLPGTGSLPELTDLCPPPATQSPSISRHEDSMFERSSPVNHLTDISHLFSLAEPLQQDDRQRFRDFSPSAIVRSYPPASQKPPPRDGMSVHQPLNNPSWTLIEYYFKEVAALFSSYDSQMNPFRTTVSRLWGSSLAMCRTMQSMAAASLVDDFPHFGPIGLKMRNEAIEIITNEAVMDDKSLLALLMLGQTASWHDPKDLGISFFNILRKHLNTVSSDNQDYLIKTSNNYRFFEEALIYWEMLLSFVADNDAVTLSGTEEASSGLDESLVLQRVPHPWTGIARDTQFTVHQVGRLVRRERKRVRTRRFTSQDDITQTQLAIDQARELEERLLSLAHPAESDIVSPGDDDTPVWHLLTMAEVFRCTGLMQLYRTFPDLLRRRLPFPGHQRQSYDPHHQQQQSSPAMPGDPFFDADALLDSMRMTTGSAFYDNDHSDSQNYSEEASSFYDAWLTTFALTTLSRLKTIPLESRTRCLQPFLLVASCSELRLLPRPAPSELTISSHAIDVSRTRKFILGRLSSFLHVLPPKPIKVCLQLVQEVWRRMDAGEPNVYWMDVMIEKGWETTMG